MASLRETVRINAAPDAVWGVVRQADGLADWFPGVTAVRMDGDARTVVMDGGLELVESVVNVDDDLRRFQYRIEPGLVPVEYHLSTIDVLEDGDASLLVYSAEVQPDDLAGLIAPAIQAGAAGLKAHLEA